MIEAGLALEGAMETATVWIRWSGLARDLVLHASRRGILFYENARDDEVLRADMMVSSTDNPPS